MLKSKSLTYALGPPVVMRISGAWKASSAAESGWIGTASRLQHRIARTRTQNIAIFARFPLSFGRRKNTQKEKRFEIVRGENINREKLLRREKQRNGSSLFSHFIDVCSTNTIPLCINWQRDRSGL